MIKKHTLFVGLNDKDTKTQKIQTLEAYKILMNVLISVGYDGATVTESTGLYRHQDGQFTIEKSLVIDILFAEDEKTNKLIDILKRALNQETIALQTSVIESKLV